MGKKRSTKLVVEVVDARDLMPKDGEGSASAFVEVDFANQLSRTNTIPKNLNPIWNQKLVFDFDETKNRNSRYIEVSVYNERRPFPGRSFLGRVIIPCTNIVRKGEEVYQQFQLEKKSLFSSVKGEIGLKLYISPELDTQSPSPPPSLPQSPSHNQARKSSNRPSSTVLPYYPPNTTLPEKTESASSASLPQSPSHFQAQKSTPRPSSIETPDFSPSTTASEKAESTSPSCLPQSPQASQTQNSQQPPPHIVLRNRATLSGTTSVDTNKTAAPLGKTRETDFYPPRIIQPQPGREIPSFPESEDISSPKLVSESSGEVPAEVFERNIREAVETTHYVHKHQAMEQPAMFMERRPQVVPSTRHHGNPHGHMSDREDYELKDTSPQIGNRWPNVRGYGGIGWFSGEKYASTHDLVEQMYYLYVRVVKAKSLQQSSITGGCDPYVEVKLGNYRGRTRHYEKKMHPEWNQVFAFSKDRIQSSVLEVFVKDKEMFGRDDYLGRVLFDLNEIPTRVPPDSPLAPQWYRLEDRRGEGKVRGEIMLAVWMGTQADEAFPEAWHSDTASVIGEGVLNTRSKVYVSPKLWYLRVNIIEAQDVLPNDKFRSPEVFVKAQVGNQVLKTRICPTPTANPFWNEDLVFVVAEPFEDQLLISVEDRVHPSKEEILGKIGLPLTEFEKRLDHRPVLSRWFNLEKYGFGVLEPDRRRELKFSSRIHLRVCLEGGYHVLDESTMYTSDQRPTARQLWKQPIGVLEVGILGAQGLLPMKMQDGRGATDAYCVAKYGQKWVRTRTILNTFGPKWNEQYTWEVYDPCTVITFGVFDNWHLGGGVKPNGGSATRDSRIGKVRIRLSTLEANRIYTNSYPLLVLHPQGVKKMGELQLAVRFTILSLANMIYIYKQPLLPKMHYLHPFTVNQVDNLRYQAMNIVAMRLGRAEPPLRKEIVEYMLDVDSHMWSMRRSKANFFRIMSLSSGIISFNKWFGDVCNWKNPITSVLVHILFLILIWYPELILPTLFLYMFLIGIWNYRRRPRHPPHMDPKLSWAEVVHPDELDEEFDTFPTSRPNDIIRMRYDRLRSVAGRIQTVAGDIATQGERFQSLLSWRDSRATSLFIMFCLCTAVMLYVTPFRVVALVSGLYYLRHPRFRSKLPSVPSNFFKRLPARTDSLL